MASAGPPLHDMLKGVSWLLGKWRSEDGKGHFPTIESFSYGEDLEFTHVGQPNIQFSFYAWHKETKKPLHREIGFLRVQPGTNNVAFIIAQNTGICELEEGEVNGQEIRTTSHTLGRMAFGKDPATKMIRRHFRREGDTLEQVVDMETSNTKMTEHLRITYKKVE